MHVVVFISAKSSNKSTYSQLLSVAAQYPSLIEILGKDYSLWKQNLVIEIVGLQGDDDSNKS